jgi:hypothetical protein
MFNDVDRMCAKAACESQRRQASHSNGRLRDIREWARKLKDLVELIEKDPEVAHLHDDMKKYQAFLSAYYDASNKDNLVKAYEYLFQNRLVANFWTDGMYNDTNKWEIFRASCYVGFLGGYGIPDEKLYTFGICLSDLFRRVRSSRDKRIHNALVTNFLHAHMLGVDLI